jgi:hypothetical protein
MAVAGCRKIEEVTTQKVRGSRFSSPGRAQPTLRRQIAARRN